MPVGGLISGKKDTSVDGVKIFLGRLPSIRYVWVVCFSAFVFSPVMLSQYVRQISVDTGPLRDMAILALTLTHSIENQWFVATCIGVSLVGCMSLYIRFLVQLLINDAKDEVGVFCLKYIREITFVIFVCWTAIAYALKYEAAYAELNFLVLIAGITMGRTFATVQLWSKAFGRIDGFRPEILDSIILALFVTAMFHPDMGANVEYREEIRWTGAFDSPNTFGSLMGVGLVLVMVQAFSFSCRAGSLDGRRSRRHWKLWTKRILQVIFAGVFFVALLKSYSRGAWVGAIIGIAYVFYVKGSAWRRPLMSISFCSASLLLVSLLCLSFWELRDSEQQDIRRVLSIADINDFSVENRLMGAVGALQMMANKPAFGFGWNEPDRGYENYYKSEGVLESRAIKTNGYIMIGTMLGLMPFFCLLAYVWFSIIGCKAIPVYGLYSQYKVPFINTGKIGADTACRAGALVLLMGFFFNSGLFKLATCATFWVLLELGESGKEFPDIRK